MPKELVLALNGARNAETVAAILSAIQAGKNVVFSTGGGAIWSFPNSGPKAMNSKTISFLETKAIEMGIKLKFVVYVPENMDAAYADSEAVMSAIQGRIARKEKWDVNIQTLCDTSKENIEFARKFKKQAVEVHTYPRYSFEDLTNRSALSAIFQSGTDLMSSNPQTPLELSCLRQQQYVSVLSENTAPQYSKQRLEQLVASKQMPKFPPVKTTSTFHITLSYDAEKNPKPLAPPFLPVGSSKIVPLHHCVAILNDGTLAPFIFIDLGRGGMHVTVHPGQFKPESMKAVTLAMQSGQSSAVFVTQLGESKTLTFKVLSSQNVEINAYNVVSHA
jgi:hypothetical protein